MDVSDDGVRWLEADLPGATGGLLDPARRPAQRSESHVNARLLRWGSALDADRDRPPGPRRRARNPRLTAPAATPRMSGIESQRSRMRPEADGHVVAEPGLAGLVFVADCLPVALAGPGRGRDPALRLARAGRRDRRPRRGGCRRHPRRDRPGDRALLLRGRGRGARRLRWRSETASPPAACSTCPRSRAACCARPGVEEIESADLCTSCEAELFFSHRRDAGRTGRQAGLVWIEGGKLSHAAA